MRGAPHRFAAALATVAVAAICTASAAAAQPSHVRHTCIDHARVMNTPGGLVIGILARGVPVVILQRTHNRTWSYVIAVRSLAGWLPSKDLC
jgi:hypothetical protein